MKTIVAIIDAGGRGSALVDKYAKSPKVDELIAIPGNDLMQINTKKPVHIFPHLKTTDKEEILKICKEYKVTLVDVAQDNAVEAGVSDLLLKNGFKVTGPARLAGQIEWDKSYSRNLLKKTSALQPEYAVFDDFEKGKEFIKSQTDKAWFIKASGLAEGKGALPALNNKEALERIDELKKFGKSGETFLIEEWLIGEEFSAFTLSDGKNFQFLGAAQDHKRAFDGDMGENTGGMGTSSPPLLLDKEILDQTYEIMSETLSALAEDLRDYKGILFLGGIVVTKNGKPKVYVIEFNARWGDPEAEVILPGIQNDWFEVNMAVAEGRLDSIKITSDQKYRVAVAGASRGYPGDYSDVKGKKITGLEKILKMPGIKLYGAGVKKSGNDFLASGGRLFYVVAEGTDVIDARNKAYKTIKEVKIEGDKGENLLHYRTDIGSRDVERIKEK